MKTKSILSIAAIAVVFFAFTNPPATKFKADTKASTLNWTGKKVTGQHNGTVPISGGELQVEGKVVKGGSFEIDLASLTVADLTDKSYNDKLVGHLKSDDFFGVEKFPKATFVISSVTPKSGNDFTVKGKLTIKGITNDIEFPANIVNDGKQLTATAKIIVDRTKYDVRYGSKTFFENIGDKAIYDDFELDLKLVALAQQGI
ncbi:MAG: YceI family protein [Bacteroidota bacterium]